MPFDWTPIEPFEAKLSLEDAKFIFGQAEKKLKDTVDESQIIVARNTLITIALITYLFSNAIGSNVNDKLVTFLGISTVYFVAINFILIRNLHPQDYKIVGTSPLTFYDKSLYEPEFDDTATQTNKRLMEFYQASIRGYQKSIDINEGINKKRWDKLRIALWMLGMSPISLFFIFVIISFFFCSCR